MNAAIGWLYWQAQRLPIGGISMPKTRSEFTAASAVPLVSVAFAALWLFVASAAGQNPDAFDPLDPGHKEEAVENPDPGRGRSIPRFPAPVSPAVQRSRGEFTSVQVNVDEFGMNIPGDAANEPSIARDALLPNSMVIGWRQFDTIQNNFRQSGYGVTADGGLTWSFPGVLEPGEFSSDPVLEYDADGNIYYYALQPNRGPGDWACYMYRSSDGGVTWPQETYARGGDKQWFTIDRTGGIGRGNLYAYWNISFSCCSGQFTRSTDGGLTFREPVTLPVSVRWGTLSVGPDGELYLAGISAGTNLCTVMRSDSAKDPDLTPQFEQMTTIPGIIGAVGTGPNPGGLLTQIWVATDHSSAATRGNVYVLGGTFRGNDPLDIGFSRSEDGGVTWSEVQLINDDPALGGAWQWFPTMSVAPNGRIDIIWNDTRDNRLSLMSTVYYSSSSDGGYTWTENVPLTPAFNPFVGWPMQNKIGDYYDMISDNSGADLAYAATFNGEQDVYHLRIGSADCNGNGTPDDEDVLTGGSDDCDGNLIPDECQRDCNGNGVVDGCDLLSGKFEDCDGNGLIDVCQPDLDGDGLIDSCDFDIDGDGVSNGSDQCPMSNPNFPTTRRGASVGDVDANCVVDLADWLQFRNQCAFANGPGVILPSFCLDNFDYDEDGDVDMPDLQQFNLLFGQ